MSESETIALGPYNVGISDGGLSNAEEDLAVFLRLIAEFVSVQQNENFEHTPVRCQDRALDEQCPGSIEARWIEADHGVRWRCPACELHGTIVDLERADLSHLREQPSAGVPTAALKVEEFDPLFRLVFQPQARSMLVAARVRGTQVHVPVTPHGARHLARDVGDMALGCSDNQLGELGRMMAATAKVLAAAASVRW